MPNVKITGLGDDLTINGTRLGDLSPSAHEEIELNNMLENIQKEALDTLCYGLDEKYKIINFSRNGARLRDRGRPGSKLVSIKDTLNYDGFKYVLLEVNSLKGYMLLMDINNQKDCYFFKD